MKPRYVLLIEDVSGRGRPPRRLERLLSIACWALGYRLVPSDELAREASWRKIWDQPLDSHTDSEGEPG